MRVSVKRIYDPSARTDGFRVLVDRLWPRGITKHGANIDLWLKTVAPSAELRKWYHEGKEGRFAAFSKKYLRELERSGAIPELKGKKTVTLVTAVKDVPRPHVPTLKAFLER